MRRVALFAHYDGHDEVKPHIVTHLRALREVCAEVILISTARLSSAELAKVQPLCERTLQSENVGYDFGMWQLALADLELDAIDELVLTNSSVFGPLFPLAPIFTQMAERDCDFWAMTDNFEIRWHLQSYFLVIKRRALRAPAFSRFFASVLPYRNKDQVIRSYELGLTQFLREQGLIPGAFVPTASWLSSPREQARLCAKRQNSTLYYPTELLAAGMPFVKMQLLRDNPARVRLSGVLRQMKNAGFDMTSVRFDRPSALKPLGRSLRERFRRKRVDLERSRG